MFKSKQSVKTVIDSILMSMTKTYDRHSGIPPAYSNNAKQKRQKEAGLY